jgi:hypothetical protein
VGAAREFLQKPHNERLMSSLQRVKLAKNGRPVVANETDSVGQTNAQGRQRLAFLVVIGSFLTIFLLVGALLSIAELSSSNTYASALAEKTFNVIVPVLAGWVGTVLAFYFSAQSSERASASLDKAIASSSLADGEKGSEIMVPLGQIKELIDLDKVKAEDLKLSELRGRFTGPSAGALDQPALPPQEAPSVPVTRLIFVNGAVFRYVLHISTLNAFLVKRANETGTLTFDDLRRDPDMLQQISRLVVFVSAATTLKDVKVALDRVAGAQDVIVTATGNSSDPMLGWISNVDLIKALNGP